MPSPVTIPARAGHYLNLATGTVNFYCNCGSRAYENTLRFISANPERFAVLTPAEVKEWTQGKLTFTAPAPTPTPTPATQTVDTNNGQPAAQ